MNSLSWLIYGIGTLDKLSGFFDGMEIILVVVSIILGIISIGMVMDGNRPDLFTKWLIRTVVACVVMFGLDVVIPSHDTMIKIAASEVGERLLTNDKVKDIIDPSTDLLKTWIQVELNKEKKLLENMNVEGNHTNQTTIEKK